MRACASVSLATGAPFVFAVEWLRCPDGRADTRKRARAPPAAAAWSDESERGRPARGGARSRSHRLRLGNAGRDLADLAVGDLAADLLHRVEIARRDPLADRPEADALFSEAEDRIPAAAPRAVLDRLDRREDGGVDLLLGAREDVRPQERLVRVHADSPHLLLAGRVERAEAAAARNLEHHTGAAADLVQGELLALRLVVPVGRVPVDHLDPGVGLLGARLVARDEPVDRRLFEPADGPDHVRAVTPLLGERRQVAGEVADLLFLEDQPDHVLRLVLERALVDVDDREPGLREAAGDGVDRVALREADADDQAVAVAREAPHVRDVVSCRGGLDHAALDPELPLGALQPLIGELVEAAVVQLAEVGDEPDLEPLLRRRLGRGRPGGAAVLAVVVAAARQRNE